MLATAHDAKRGELVDLERQYALVCVSVGAGKRARLSGRLRTVPVAHLEQRDVVTTPKVVRDRSEQRRQHVAPHVVDLDDAVQGPAVQDLWMLLAGDARAMAQQLDELLRGYEDFADFDDRERALVEPLRTLRMLRHAAWLASRWDDPTFPIHFPFFGSAAYWSQHASQLDEQRQAMAATAR